MSKWEWVNDWKLLSLALGDDGTVLFTVEEDEGRTEGRAGFGRQTVTLPVARFLADGPPDAAVEHSGGPGASLAAMEAAVAEIGVPEPPWLAALRFQRDVCTDPVDTIRDRLACGDPDRMRLRVGGRDALYWAVWSCRAEAVEVLLGGLGASANQTYEVGRGPTLTPLMVAALACSGEKDPAVFEALRRGGADLEQRNSYGETALLWLLGTANTSGVARPAFFRWLLKSGADANALRTGPAGVRDPAGEQWTPLYCLVKSLFRAEVCYDVARELIAAGATVEAMPQRLREPFRSALRAWHPDAWRLGKSLAVRPNPRDQIENRTLYFRDVVQDTETDLCGVGSVTVMNTPYAPDETYSFAAVLYAVAGDDRRSLFVRVVKVREVLEAREEEVAWFGSSTHGREWDRRESGPTAVVELSSLYG